MTGGASEPKVANRSRAGRNGPRAGAPPIASPPPPPEQLAPGRRILPLAAPLVVSFVLRASFQWVDAIYASLLPEGDAAIAAIGLATPFEFALIACWVGTSNGLTARLAAALGAREGAKILQLQRATNRIVRVLVILFLLLAAGIWFLGDHYAPPEAADAFRVYGTVLVAGSGVASFWSILPDSLVKAHHDTKSTMWAGLLSGGTNVVLNTVFVLVFGWGLIGIAASTVIGRVAGLLYALHAARRHEQRRLGRGQDTAPGTFARPVRAIGVLAMPAGATFLLIAAESLFINGLLSGAATPGSLAARLLPASVDPTSAVAAWYLFDSAGRLLAMPIIATGVALLPLAARLWGAGDLRGIAAEVRTAMLASLVWVAALTPAVLLLAPAVARALVDAPEAGDYATLGLRWIPLAVLGAAPLYLLRSAFDGMQMPRPGLVASAVRTCLLAIPLLLLGMHAAAALGYPPIAGAFPGFCAGAGGASLIMWVWLRRVLREDLPVG